jgi:hypothetical protein
MRYYVAVFSKPVIYNGEQVACIGPYTSDIEAKAWASVVTADQVKYEVYPVYNTN